MSQATTAASASRRTLLLRSAQLSLPAVALLGGVGLTGSARSAGSASSQDVDVLNEILGTEHEGIAAYQVMIDRTLLHKEVLTLAQLIQSHHMAHRDFLAATIQRLGGVAVSAKSLGEYATDLNLSKIDDQAAALALALTLELGAANAYLDMLPSTSDGELAKAAARVAADEVMHWTALKATLQQQLPSQAMSFGL